MPPPLPDPLLQALPPPPRLLNPLRHPIRYLHHSIRTEQAFGYWVRASVRFHGLRHPAGLGGYDIRTVRALLGQANPFWPPDAPGPARRPRARERTGRYLLTPCLLPTPSCTAAAVSAS